MKISLFLALALPSSAASFLIFAPPARAAETPAQRAGRAAITAAYVKIDQAMAVGNFAAVTPYFAPDYSVRDADGKVRNRAQSVAKLRKPAGVSVRFSKIVRAPKFTWRDKDVKNVVVANQLTAVGKAGTDGVTVPLKVVSHWRDLWTSTPRGWKIRQRITTKSQTWVNGKRRR